MLSFIVDVPQRSSQRRYEWCEQVKALIRVDTVDVLRYYQAFERLASLYRPAVASRHWIDTQNHSRPISLIKDQSLAAGGLWLWCRALGSLLADDTMQRSVMRSVEFSQIIHTVQ